MVPWSSVPEGGFCAAARGRMKLKKADAAQPGYSASHFPSPHQEQYWLQAGYPMMVSPLLDASFSSSATNTHLNIGSGVPMPTSMFPHSHCSDRCKIALSCIMEPLNLAHGQETVLRIMAKA